MSQVILPEKLRQMERELLLDLRPGDTFYGDAALTLAADQDWKVWACGQATGLIRTDGKPAGWCGNLQATLLDGALSVQIWPKRGLGFSGLTPSTNCGEGRTYNIPVAVLKIM